VLNLVNKKEQPPVQLKPVDSGLYLNPLTDLMEDKQITRPARTILKHPKPEGPQVYMPKIKTMDSKKLVLKEWAGSTGQSNNINSDIRMLTQQIIPNARVRNTGVLVKSKDKLPEIVGYVDKLNIKDPPSSSQNLSTRDGKETEEMFKIINDDSLKLQVVKQRELRAV